MERAQISRSKWVMDNYNMTDAELEFIRSTAKTLNLANIEIESKSCTSKGDGYMGLIKFIKLKELTNNEELHMVLKSAYNNEKIRHQAPVRSAYVREIYMYNQVFPEFLKFQNQHKIARPFTGVAKIFNTMEVDKQEMLLIQDLKQKGYKLWDRKIPMDAGHVKIVILEYAKFHSLSMAMRECHPEKFSDLTRCLVSIFGNNTRKGIVENIMSSKFQRAYEVLENETAKMNLQKFEREISKFVFEELRDETDHLVITHGDCWCNNMMFKYEDKQNTQIPTSVCFLDWQTSKMGSPVMDLSYFLYICGSKPELYDYKNYLLLYHKTVSDNLNSFGCDPEKVFPFSLLEHHWRKYSKFGLYMCFINLETALNEAENALDLDKLAKDGKDIFRELNIGEKSRKVMEEYNRRIADLIIFMSENRFL